MPKEKNDPKYTTTLNDFFRITGQENKIKEDKEKEIIEIRESELDRIISKNSDLDKYRIDKEKDPKIVQVTKRRNLFI